MARAGNFASLSVLAVEDEPFHASILRRVLGMLEIGEIALVANGAEAMQLLESAPTRFDVVVTDLMMPVMDGFKLAKAIRESAVAQIRDLPIIVMSGLHSEEEEALRAKLPKIVGFVPKPVKLATVYDMLVKVRPQA